VGHRVVVRRIVGVRGNRPLFSDVLGELVEYDATGLTIATRRGRDHVADRDPTALERIGHESVHAAKRVPPSPRDVAALERIANAAWPAPDTEPLGDWLLRAAGGWTGRANSALPLGRPGTDQATAIDTVTRWYAARGLPARINVPLPTAARLDAALTAAGWSRSVPTLVLTAPLAAVLAAVPARPDLPPVYLDRAPTEAWLAVVAARKGALPPAAHAVLTGPPAVMFAAVEGDLAVGRGAVVGGHLHLGLLEVAEKARRQGLARHVTRVLAEWGFAQGGGTAFLQVESTNPAALALYRGLGFTTHHEYVTRTTDVPPGGAWPSGSPRSV
jgi:ribosomal protein S18 acetylase RimI-like enzyme